jgi:ADP-ribose pyrophosphatase
VSGEPTVASRTVYRGRVISLRVDDVRLPSGRVAQREVVEHPGAAAVVAVTDQDEVVLVRQYRKAVGRELLEIPAGTLEAGETPLACARRELSEETGLAAGSLAPLVTFVPSPGVLTEEITVFLAQGLRPAAGAARAEEEGLRVVRVPRERISGLIAAGEIRDAKTLIGLLLLLLR